MAEKMREEVATLLKGIDRYNPENLSILERYVEAQAAENTYDLEANLAVLKLRLNALHRRNHALYKFKSSTFLSKNQNKIQIVIHNYEIQKVTSCKYLGVILDNELELTEHVDSVCKKLFELIGVFYELRSNLPAVV